MPELAKSEYFKQAIGIVFNEENAFAAAKERTNLKQGVDIINQLYALQDSKQQPIFSMKFLVQRYLNMNDEDMALNEQYKEQEILEELERAKLIKDHKEQMLAQNGGNPEDMGESGGMSDFDPGSMGPADDDGFVSGGSDFDAM